MEKKEIVILNLAALGLWLTAFIQWLSLPFSLTPIPDSDTALYWYLSKVIAKKGIFFGNVPIFFSTYYAYLYYGFSLVGNPILTATVFNGLLYLLSLTTFTLLLKELFGRKAALAGGVLFLLTKPLLFYAIVPIKAMVVFFLFTLFIFLLIKEKITFAGMSGGLLFNIEGIFLPLFLIYAMNFLVQKKIKQLFLLIGGFLIVLLPAVGVNYKKSSTLSLSSPTSGIHFYIGNQKGATGVYREVWGIRPNAFGHYYDAKRKAEIETGRRLTDKEVNEFWWKKGIKRIFESPVSWIELYLRKLLLFFNSYEIPNNYNLNLIGKKVWILGLLPVNFAVALAIGVFGYTTVLFYRERKNILDITFLFYPLILSLFFITSRYRLIYYLPLLAYGAVALKHFYEVCCFRREVFKKAVIGATLAFSLSNFPLAENVRAGYDRVFRWKTNATVKLRKALKEKNLREIRRIFRRARMEEINTLFRKKY